VQSNRDSRPYIPPCPTHFGYDDISFGAPRVSRTPYNCRP
jgi:hypothetical protein